ncbi:Decaprenylphosphoryl-2-keto-beta-D-erythro-pentose reductase [Planctomycetales bacterium 10988]|nr:Decaprenylphosphoryl-2-keto-beta-D-erythro-pentose reductase [Planctomycetales bacterium 10988]
MIRAEDQGQLEESPAHKLKASAVKVICFGATRGMGRSLARLLAAKHAQIFLLGRNEEELKASARDLETRGALGEVGTAKCDLLDPEGFSRAIDAADRHMEGFNTVIVTAGLFGTQEELEKDSALLQKVLFANFTGTILFCEEVRKRLLARKGGGTLCVFSSVAGDRGRKPVILYGATKAGLSHYLEGLDHRYRSEGLVTICVKPGFVKTSMTSELKPPPFAGDPDRVARDVLAAIQKKKPMIYSPRIWGWILGVIRRLPRFVMRKIGF